MVRRQHKGGAQGSCPIRGLHPAQSIPRSQSLRWAPLLGFCPMVDRPWGLALSQAHMWLLQAQQYPQQRCRPPF